MVGHSGRIRFRVPEPYIREERARCVDERRASVSAAFFLSPEFRETGYFVYRFYLASFTETPARPRAFRA